MELTLERVDQAGRRADLALPARASRRSRGAVTVLLGATQAGKTS